MDTETLGKISGRPTDVDLRSHIVPDTLLIGDLTARQRDVLLIIEGVDGPSATTIQQQLGVIEGTTVPQRHVTDTLQSLLSDGYIRENEGLYYLTKTGSMAVTEYANVVSLCLFGTEP